MALKTQGFLTGEFLVSEAEGTRSRDQLTVTISGGVALPSGTVLGKITATGKYLKPTTGAADGSQTAAAVLLTDLGATTANGDYQTVAITRDAEVISSLLNGGTGPLAGAAASLATVGIIVR